ncbi:MULTISPECIES: polyphosphate polymerase domain-containing protein [unclassified Fusibacter]|uniref:polyphosphate polymerase domain-containing protein n=1 Tax=unclassified Fusibacter TaxID=2624464 RepID=UPI0010127038|nr:MULTISPECIES: polyphosphate polymerase domain-containing protein [unclassified Fusibacter]MCK8061652.1 polyphosphate polymerase domain-containing protein [Fusibacter sp. A2]NPE23836.1 polyphosphate polymerase domain-containing protein [Fusibacter sp. A1]RXV58609.1 VTC domain-containing protein [Fusibacter sp. A1]
MRKELKYQLDVERSELLIKLLSLVCAPDSHTGTDGSYQVTSLYFDDRFDSHLWEKNDGEDKRPKLRLRYYNDDKEKLYLESKQKKGDYVLKHRRKITREEYDLMLVKPSIVSQWLPGIHGEGLIPVKVVTYERKAFIIPCEGGRITFDRQLRASTNFRPHLFGDCAYAAISDENTVIFEVKFNESLPWHIQRIISDVGIKTAWSKYATSRQI